MQIIRTECYEEMSNLAAQQVITLVVNKPDAVLGLATGSTPIGLYEALVRAHREDGVDFSQVRTVNLDEYLDLPPLHVQSYRYFMQKHLFDHINIKPENTHVPDGLAPDPVAEGARYDALIESLGGIDIQLLGIGHTGHIGFNEPNEAFIVPTHPVDLDQLTIDMNSRFFNDISEVPRRAITMGMGSICHARKIIMIASGEGKAAIVYKALRGPVTPKVSASVLQLLPNVQVFVDEGAAKFL